MPASKFTQDRKERVLELLSVGASRRTAAAGASLDHVTLLNWIEKGKKAAEGTAYHDFYQKVLAAEAHPRIKALTVVNNEMANNPNLAKWFLERREPGYEPPQPEPAKPMAPVTINLNLPGAGYRQDYIEGEVVDVEDGPAQLPPPG